MKLSRHQLEAQMGLLSRYSVCVGILIFAFGLTGVAMPAPFTSTEPMTFVDKSTDKYMKFGEPKSFVGIVQRKREKSADLQSAYLYAPANSKVTKVSVAECKSLLAQVVGPLDKISLKVISVLLFETKLGDACDVEIADDLDKKATYPEQRAIIGFIHAKPYALLFELTKKSDAAVQENIRTFWRGLR